MATATTETSSSRPLLIGPDAGPSPPYPLRMSGKVISGFGRGSKELGIPTANLPVDDARTPWISSTPSGVYFGWASLQLPSTHPDCPPTTTDGETNSSSSSSSSNGWSVYPMVMSIGYNPFYKNTVRSAEVHVLHEFAADFYGVDMRLLILGFIREEKDYSGLDALIADINLDCEVARRSLAREGWAPREVEVEITGDNSSREGGAKKRLRGTLAAGWLIRPDESEENGADGK
ncbi:riboflavin kinase [Canariomyces notabilis]|uniref:Riboflavin kinase n=1 Tax=Canariomyces notabilis TaxID=2074819 RepID=A0AAN6TBG8_9PEZI|nr:riboflavin kinase [Canariomyces arenarius]